MIATDGLDLFDSLSRLADLVGEPNELSGVLGRAVSMIADATGADLCLVVDPTTAASGAATILAQSTPDADGTGAVALAAWIAPIARRVGEANRPLLVQMADASDSELQTMLSERGFASAVAAPIPANGQAPLVLVAFSVVPNGFANADLGFVSSMSSILALARRLRAVGEKAPTSSPPSAETPDAQQTAGAGRWELDLTSGVLLWSDASYGLFGFDKEAITPTQELFDSLVDGRDSERLRAALRETRVSGRPGVIEYRITRSDGTPRRLRQQHELIEGGSQPPRMIGTMHDVTLQWETSDALHQNDERLRAVLNASAIGIAMVEDDGGTAYGNRAYTDLLGYSTEEMQQLTLEDLTIEPDRSRVAEIRARSARGERAVEAEEPITLVRKDGEQRQVIVTLSRSEAAGGMLRILNLRDVTKEVRAQAELSESQQLMEDRARRDEAAQRLGHFGYWDRSLDTDALHWTDEVYRIFGVTQGEFEPTSTAFDEFVHPEDRNTVREMRRRTLDEGTGYAVRHRIVRPDGVVRTVDETGDLVRDELAKRSMLVGTIRDVTELVAVEEALRDSDAHLRSILDSSQHAVLVMGSGDTVDYRNRAFTEMLGYAVDEFRDRSLAQFAAPESTDRAAAAVYAVTSGAQQSADVRLQLVRKDGALVDVDAQIVTVQSAGRAASCLIDLQDVTRRVAAERQIAEGETRFREIFDTASSGLLIIGADGTPETANDAFLDIFGLETTEIGEHTPSELVVDERERAEIELCLDQHLKGEEGSCQHVLEIHRYSDGQTRHVSVTCQTLFHNGGVRGVLTEFTDRTEQIESERALTESRERLQQAQQIAHVGHWDWDIVTDELSWSDEVFRIFGLARPQFGATYPAFLDAVHQDDRDAVTAAVEDAVERGARYRVQYRAIRPDGEIRNVEESGEVSRLEDGTAARMLGIVQDVTERVASEQALAESESRLRAIFDASHNGISFFSDRRTPPFRNRAFAEMLGYTLEETHDLALGALLPLDDDHAWIDDLWERVERGEPATDLGLKHFVHKDGHIVDVDIKLSDVALDGGVIGHVADLRDVTTELIQRRALEASETRARLIFESTSSGLLLMRLNGEIEIANQAFCDILGIATGEVRTLKVHRIIDRQDVKPVLELFRARLRGDLTTPAEVIVRFNRLDDGRTRALRVDARALIEDGEVAGMLAEVRDITQRVETRGALEESQARLARAQANARIGGWELDVASNELTWSDELYGLFGQDPETDRTSIGGLLHGIHKDDRARFSETFEQAQAAGTALDVRVRFTGADGRPRIVWSRGELVVDEHGEPLRWEGTTQDITELAEAQQALAASEARLNVAQASAHIGSWSRDLNTDEVYWSDELYRLLGAEPGAIEPSRDSFSSFIHPDDIDAYQAEGGDGEERASFQTQARFVGADQVERILVVSGELVRDQHGEPSQWIGIAQDATEQAAAQEALAESESRLNLAQSIAHVGSWGRHLVRNQSYWSDEFFRLMGLEPGVGEPSLGRLVEYMHPDDRARFQETTRDAVDRYDVRVRCIGEDGVERLLWMHGELTRDGHGKPLRWDGTSQDITELAQAQEALAEAAARLELAQSQAHVGSFSRNLATGAAYWSDEFYRLIGHEPGAIEPSSEHLYSMMQANDRDEFLEAIRDATDSGVDGYDIRSRFIRTDGQERVLWQYGELSRDPEGEPFRWDGTMQDVTELVTAQAALAEREEFLRTTLEAVRSGVMVVNPARQIISANGHASEIMGYAPDEFLSVQLENVVRGEDLALMLTRFAARVRGEEGPERTLVRAWKQDGTELDLDVRGAPLMQSGELRGVVVDFRDVTEELAVQRRLEDTANRLHTLFENVRSGLLVVGPDMVPITCNDALATMLGSSTDDVLSQSVDAFLLPEERQIVGEAMEARMRGEVVLGRIPSTIIRADGVQRAVDIRSTPFIVDGQTIGLLCEVNDITEDLALQQEVQETAERLNTVVETVSTGLIVVGLDQRPLTVNQALCDILGYTREALMQKTFVEISHPDDAPFLLERFAQRLSGGNSRNRHQSRALRADGSVIQVDISAEPFRIGGEIVGVLGEVRDITEALALQQEVENTAERLNTVFESVSTGLAIIGPDRLPITVNPALSEITGYSREELLVRSFEEGLYPEDREGLLERFQQRISGEIDGQAEYSTRIVRKDGSTAHISVSAEPFHIGGQFIGVLAEIRDVTEELSLQRQIQETADRLNNVFESVSTGLLVIGPNRIPLTVNQALCQITGYPREMLLSTRFDDLIHQDDLAPVTGRFASRMAGGEGPHHLQARTIRRDGTTITVDLSAEPFRVGGEIVGVLAEVRDITDDLELQHRVQETADRLSNVFESVSTGLAVIGPDRRPHTMNQAFAEILGRSQEELSAETFDRHLHPDDLELILQRFARRLAGEEVVPHHINVRVIRGDGELIDIDLSARPFVIGGAITGVLAEIRDITEELSLQALVTESAEQINTILEATPDAIIVADDHDVILRVNAATETIFGGGPDELIGQSVKMLVGGLDGEVDPTDAEHRQRAGSTSAIQELVASNFREATGQRLDGSEFPAELAVAETELNDGRKLFVAAIRDITERKHAEEQLQLLNTELETRSRERQALVQQLLSAQEEERRTVAYEIHDGPAQQLAAAQMFLEAFAFEQNIDIEDQSADHLQRAKAYLDTGLTETRRIMSGLRPALLDDLGLADALHQLLTELANRAGIQLELDSSKLVDDLSPAIEITLYRIAQEAAGNALKHSGSEELSVHLESDGSMARLRVTDHGRGFNPNTIQGPRDGRRFGLVGMRERVALLEGQFEVDSAPGRGTTITATIPLREDIDK